MRRQFKLKENAPGRLFGSTFGRRENTRENKPAGNRREQWSMAVRRGQIGME
jgi:hypothetical protein